MKYNIDINDPFVIENDYFAIYSTQSLKEFAEQTFNDLNDNRQRIWSYFGITDFRKVNSVLYDDITAFRSFVLSLRGEGAKLPEYAIGVFDLGMNISYIDSNKITDENKQNLMIKNSIHEYIHIINQEMIYDKRSIWLDEGIAMYLSGQKDYLKNTSNFNRFLENSILPIVLRPLMNDLNHGLNFVTDEYNGYDLSYLCVRYLDETLDRDAMHNILKNYDYAQKVGNIVLDDAIQYYENQFNLVNSNKDRQNDYMLNDDKINIQSRSK